MVERRSEVSRATRTWPTNKRDTERSIQQGEPGAEAGDAGASGCVRQTWAPISEVPSLDKHPEHERVRHSAAGWSAWGLCRLLR